MGRKNWIFVAPLILVAGLIAGATALVLIERQDLKVRSQQLIGKTLPSIQMIVPSGINEQLTKEISRNSHSNKKTILVFWATWCEPCLRELPLLKKHLKRRELEQIDFVLINYDTGDPKIVLKEVNAWIISQGLESLPLFFDFKNELAAYVGMAALPFSMGIDENQKIAWTHIGELDFTKKLLFDQN